MLRANTGLVVPAGPKHVVVGSDTPRQIGDDDPARNYAELHNTPVTDLLSLNVGS